jgi:hypothetical protein
VWLDARNASKAKEKETKTMAIPFNRRQIALGMGLFYTAIGALGLVPGLTVATGQPGQSLLLGWLGTSDLLSPLHVAIGLVAIWASQARGNPRQVLIGLAAAFALLAGAAFVAPIALALGLNGADTVVHLVSLLLAGYVGLVEAEPATA